MPAIRDNSMFQLENRFCSGDPKSAAQHARKSPKGEPWENDRRYPPSIPGSRKNAVMKR